MQSNGTGLLRPGIAFGSSKAELWGLALGEQAGARGSGLNKGCVGLAHLL